VEEAACAPKPMPRKPGAAAYAEAKLTPPAGDGPACPITTILRGVGATAACLPIEIEVELAAAGNSELPGTGAAVGKVEAT